MDVKFTGLRGLDDYVRVDVTEDGVLFNDELLPNVIGARLVVNEYHDSNHITN